MKEKIFGDRKRTVLGLIIIALLVVVGVFIFTNVFETKTNTSKSAEFTMTFDYNDTHIITDISKEDSARIVEILNDGEMFFDSGLSCGFGDHMKFTINNSLFGDTFYPACDGCDIVKYKFKNINLSNKTGAELRSVLRKYGASFPCV